MTSAKDQPQCSARPDCDNSYCSNCSRVRHRAGKRKEHSISRLSDLPNVAHVSLGEDLESATCKRVL